MTMDELRAWANGPPSGRLFVPVEVLAEAVRRLLEDFDRGDKRGERRVSDDRKCTLV